MIALLALILELAGVAFLVLATLGVLRFADPFQRMHAATKAGTVGAGLVLIGTAISQSGFDATVIALLTMLFLVATMPVAGHLLGRACYISGAPLQTRHDALEGVLPRMEQPLEEREVRQRKSFISARRRGLRLRKNAAAGSLPPLPGESGAGLAEAGYDAVRFAVIAPEASRVARRAQALAAARRVSLTGVAVIDESYLGSPDADAREAIRARLAEAIAETRAATAGSSVPLSLSYEEGDPLELIPGRDPAGRELLLLPTDGWCHHGAPVGLPADSARGADKLFALAKRHNGPTLFVGAAGGNEGGGEVVVLHDGGRKVQRLVLWVLQTRLWPIETLVVAGPAAPEQGQALTAAAAAVGADVVHLPRPEAPAGALLPARYATAAAVILADLSPATRLGAAGTFWQDRLIPGFRGDVLIG